MKISELVPIYLAYKINYVKKSTYSTYVTTIERHIIPFFGDKESIEETDVQDFVIKKLSDKLKNTSIQDILIMLKTIAKYGHKRKIFPYVPWEVEYPREVMERKLEVYSIDDHKKLIKYLKEDFTFKNLGVLIAVSTGMRIGEVCGLRWEDINMEESILTVKRTVQRIGIIKEDGTHATEIIIDTPKTICSNREIPLSNDLIKMIKPLLKVVKHSNFIITNDKEPSEPSTFRIHFKKISIDAGLPKLKFHGLRHTFATRCINSNVDIKTVSVILGHSDIATTLNTYSHPDAHQKKSAIDKMFKTLG